MYVTLRYSVIVLFLVLQGSAISVMAATHEESLKNDQTQQHYTRKSITFLGTVIEGNLNVPDDARAAIEKIIRREVELKRFDYNKIDISKFRSMGDFISALRQYVKKRAFDRAAADAEFQTQFSSARVYMEDIDRVMKSAYFYQIEIFVYRTKPMICPYDTKTAARLDCTPGVAGIKAVVNAKVAFYKADLTSDKGKGYSHLRTIKEMPAKGFTPFDIQPPAKPKRMSLAANASDEQKKRAAEAYNQAMARWRKAMEEYKRRMPELEARTRVKAVVEALSGPMGLAKRLAMGVKKIPDFQLKTPVEAALSDGVEFWLGKGEGLELDDTYEVAYYDVTGKKGRSGWVKVRKIGDAKGSGEGKGSYAEKVHVARKFVGGEMMLEYPMLKVDFGLHGIFEYTMGNLTDPNSSDDYGMYFGGGAYILYDLAPYIGWSEFWIGLEGDFLAVGKLAGQSVNLVHAMIGLRKKWYINSFVVNIGLRGGISYYSTGDDSQNDTLIGGGGDAILGFEYYVHPMFSVYLNAVGRYFTNPLIFASADAKPEMGAQANLGIRLGF